MEHAATSTLLTRSQTKAVDVGSRERRRMWSG
jgi:hypothetical protein